MAHDQKKLYEHLPSTPGVYLMRGKDGAILYIGKAANLKRRVSSYFLRPHDYRIQKMVSEMRKIDFKKTDTAIEALILESELIKKHQPPFNVLEKDDTSFLYVEITRGAFPAVLLVRGKDPKQGMRYGPFTSAASIRYAMKLLRRIFSYSTHRDNANTTKRYLSLHSSKNSYHSDYARQRGCFDYQIGLCPGTCVGAVNKEEYAKTIRHIKLFFAGKKKQIIRDLKKEMKRASTALEFEKAAQIQKQLFALQHIHDIALIKDSDDSILHSTFSILPSRIEGYDISNISGTSAVGSMVVFTNGKPDKNEYRKFKIRTIAGSDDTGMLREILERRLNNSWQLPDLMLVDGGIGQVNMVRFVLRRHKLDIPVVGLAKGPERKRNDVTGTITPGIDLATLIKVRNEAHRFAVHYHRTLRQARSMIH